MMICVSLVQFILVLVPKKIFYKVFETFPCLLTFVVTSCLCQPGVILSHCLLYCSKQLYGNCVMKSYNKKHKSGFKDISKGGVKSSCLHSVHFVSLLKV